jgi:Tol biopolymer transport system component
MRDLWGDPDKKETVMRVAASIVTGLAALVLVSTAPSATTAQTTRISVSGGHIQGDRPSFVVGASASGRFVAFTSLATNLVQNDTNGRQDAFVYDRHSARIERVSVTSSGAQAEPGSDPVGGSAALDISANGRYVLFRSDAPNLVPGKTKGSGDAFIHDRVTGKTRSVPPTGVGVDGGELSENGRYAVIDAGGDVFRYDLTKHKLLKLTAGANSWCSGGVISAGGRYVAFESNASNLVRRDTNKLPDVFVRDVRTGKTTRVSVTSGGKQGTGKRYSNGSNAPAISADGRYVAFHSDMRDLVRRDTNGVFDIFVHDRVTGKTQRVSVSSAGRQANQESLGGASFSPDGRYVAFTSLATNLVPHDKNGITDVFMRDLRTKRTSLVSLGVNGQGDDASFGGLLVFTRTAHWLVFSSWAANLVAGDTNGVSDVFVRDLGR